MKLNDFIDDFEIYRQHFTCGECELNRETCNDVSCNTQCIRQYMKEKRLTVVSDYKCVITGNEFLDSILKKIVLDWCLDIDWDDFTEYNNKNCRGIICSKCKYVDDEFCRFKLFLQYLKEKSL